MPCSGLAAVAGRPTFGPQDEAQGITRVLSSLVILVLAIVPVQRAFGQPAQPAEVKVTHPASNPLRDALRPVPETAVFKMDGYYLWDPSLIKVGDTYHLFASRWPVTSERMKGWMKSHVIRATSKSLFGPYQFQEVVLSPSKHPWATQAVHNPKVMKTGNRFLIYHLGIPQWKTGFAYADSIEGPWTPVPHPVLATNNPAIIELADGSAYAVGKFKPAKVKDGQWDAYMQAFEADTINGPYRLLGGSGNRLPNDFELEDPTLWWAGNRYNVICTDWQAKVTGVQKAVVYYTSKNGIDYELDSPIPVWSQRDPVPLRDGRSLGISGVERPQVFLDESGALVALLAGIYPANRDQESTFIVIRPVDHFIPGNDVLADSGATGSGTANGSLAGAPANLTAPLNATSQPGNPLPIVGLAAFPGAEGYGAAATGGRGGSVYHVTHLNDSGVGSFRDAVSQPNRTVVFDVGGIIKLTSALEVVDNITIAGQTAPGQGVSTSGATVYLNHGFGAADSYGHSNIIVRHMRFREGYKESHQAYSLALKPAHKVMIDHCSVEIGNWQTFSITHNAATGEQPSDITVQNSIIGAGVSNQLGVLDWNPVNLTWHHNLFLDNGGRDPKASGTLQIINDVVYNYVLGIYGDGGEHCDFIGNYHIAGPDTNATSVNQGMNFNHDVTGVFYASGNYWANKRDGTLGGVPLVPGTAFRFNPVVSATPLCSPAIPVTVDSARLAYHKVVSVAGASLSRDPLDSALIDQVASLGTRGPGGTLGVAYKLGLYMKHVTPYTDAASGNPIPTWSVSGGTAPTDTDGDGMPDDWELATGSNVNVADNNVAGTGGYTRLENYLNWMADPHARVQEDAPSMIDLSQYTAGFNNHRPTFTVTAPAHGTATLLADGHSLQYTPATHYAGLDATGFTVTASDGSVLTQTLGILVNRASGILK